MTMELQFVASKPNIQSARPFASPAEQPDITPPTPPNRSGASRLRYTLIIAVALEFLFLATSSMGPLIVFLAIWVSLGIALNADAFTRWTVGLVFAAILVTVGTAIAVLRTGHVPLSVAKWEQGAPQLSLVSSTGYESKSGSYRVVEGQVKNLSWKPLKDVVVRSTWLDETGKFVASKGALIEHNPILPGQTSAFRTMAIADPAMSLYHVEFESVGGGPLDVEDDRAAE